MISIILLWASLFALAFLMGFTGNRTTLCAVKAVDEVINKRSCNLLLSFLKIIIWVFGINLLFELFSVISPARDNNYAFRVEGLLGGVIFGFGATINGGCSLYTLIRFCRGNTGILLSFLGLCLGSIVARHLIGTFPELGPKMIEPFRGFKRNHLFLLASVFVAWGSYECWMLFKGTNLAAWKQRMKSELYELRLSSALLGLSNGVLVVFVGTWMYTHLIISSLMNVLFVQNGRAEENLSLIHSGLFLVLLLGIFLSAYLSKTFVINFKFRWNYLFGGFLMGVGAMLIPGGNDVILLNSIPTISFQAVPSYLAMLIGIAALLLLKKRIS